MASHETGKFRAARIPLDYYKRADGLGRLKNLLLGLVLLATVGGLVAAAVVRRDRGTGLVSRGPVASVHATWDNDCEACHTPFQPTSGENWLGRTLSPAHSNDQKCTTCHSGGVHHKEAKDPGDCASCHHEHRGRDAPLVRVADNDCTRCHANLAAHTSPGAKDPYENVSRFDRGQHPEFKLFRDGATPKDPGKLKFNHRLHLTAGLNCQFTLDKIDPAARAWYQDHQDNKDEKAPVQLACQACHVLDKGDLPGKEEEKPFKERKPFGPLQQVLVPPRNAGSLMLPVSYDTQCAACHPLTIERKDPDDVRSGDFAVPHHLQPAQVHEFLQGYYTDRLLRGDTRFLSRPAAGRPMPGKLPAEESEQARKLLEDKVSAAERLLYSKNTCLECHEAVTEPGKAVPKAIQPTNVPAVWFPHAVFDHMAHRAVRCEECHAGTRESAVSGDVLMPRQETCLRCHAPSAVAGGGARSDCAECHRYHNADNPLQGRGAAAGGPVKDLDIHTFLHAGRQAGGGQ